MTKINQLSDNLIRQIAAGEVIVEPLSVIKEALENSLDAGASDIQVDITNGGNTKIIIADNGIGISKEDLEIITTRHSTSKIKTEQDLFNVLTLGFRGEFLASLLAAADLTIISKEKSSSNAFKAFYTVGSKPTIELTTRSPGTSIIVMNLFEKLPARRSFLPKPTTSIARIHELIRQFTLAYSDIRFRLISDGKDLFTSQPGNKLNAIGMIFGSKSIKNFIPIAGESEDKKWKIEGFISKPVEVRSSRSYEYFFVNGRIIENKVLQQALEDGYSNFLTTRKFPIAVLYFTTKPDEYDANVHPAKKEIRIKSENVVYQFVRNLIYTSLTQFIVPGQQQAKAQKEPIQQSFEENISKPTWKKETTVTKNEKKIARKNAARMATNSEKTTNEALKDDFDLEESSIAEDEHPLLDSLQHYYDRVDITQIGDENFVHVVTKDEIHHLEPIIQLEKTFIIARNDDFPENLYFIDQHAVSERITLETMLFSKKKIKKQSLLIPILLVLNPEEQTAFQEIYPTLKDYGYSIEQKENLQIQIQALPLYQNKKLSQEQLIFNLREIITDRLTLKQSIGKISEAEQEMLKSIACHNSIRAGDILTNQEMKELLFEMYKAQFPYVCCHGRPSIFKLPLKRLYKLFWRT